MGWCGSAISVRAQQLKQRRFSNSIRIRRGRQFHRRDEEQRRTMKQALPWPALRIVLATFVMFLLSPMPTFAQVGGYTKAVVADHIKKVEDGVDDFRDYLEKRGETVKNNAQTAQRSGTRRGQANPANTQARKDQANRTKDELDSAMDDLNGSTNRLRRRFEDRKSTRLNSSHSQISYAVF